MHAFGNLSPFCNICHTSTFLRYSRALDVFLRSRFG